MRSLGTQPGTLTGIDKVHYERTYPETAVVYGLYTIRDPDPANLALLKDGDLNCVAQRVVEHFEGALRGQGLTPTRRQKIQKWEEQVHETGATVNDVAKLEKVLKRAIILRDIAGEDIYNSGKYGRGGNGNHRPVELIVHSGHTWSRELHFPQSREVHFYEGNVWQVIREATQNEPTAVWVLGGEQERQLSVDQFVLQDGHTYRTREAHERLQKVCDELGDPAIAERAFEVNHAASIVAKEKESLEADLSRSSKRHPESLCRARPRWSLELNGLRYERRCQHPHEDLLSRLLPGLGEAKPYFERFGHPTHRMTRAAINGRLVYIEVSSIADIL